MLKFKNSLPNFMELGPIKQEASPVLLFKAILYGMSSVRKSVNTMIQSKKKKNHPKVQVLGTSIPYRAVVLGTAIIIILSCGSWNIHLQTHKLVSGF